MVLTLGKILRRQLPSICAVDDLLQGRIGFGDGLELTLQARSQASQHIVAVLSSAMIGMARRCRPKGLTSRTSIVY